ncbi:MAG TPA: response regulator transcription factor [Acidimicrobiales bacterium]|nr:response regulator transcription factor [Acidimicrobiales bacterium]
MSHQFREAATTGPAVDERVRVAIVNDYEVVVAGVLGMLAPYSDQVEVVELDVDRDPTQVVDVALFDTYGQPGLGVSRVRSLAASREVGAVAVYTWTANEAARRAAYGAGASALIAKTLPADQLVASVQLVAAGETVDTGRFQSTHGGQWPGAQWGLSARESETLALVATGMPNRAIAQALFISENTVRTHLKSIFRKLAVTSRSQAVARALSDSSFAMRRRAALLPADAEEPIHRLARGRMGAAADRQEAAQAAPA